MMTDTKTKFVENNQNWSDVMPLLLHCVREGGESGRIAEKEIIRLAQAVDAFKEQAADAFKEKK